MSKAAGDNFSNHSADDPHLTPTPVGFHRLVHSISPQNLGIPVPGTPAELNYSEPEHWREIPGYVIHEHPGEGGFGRVYRSHSIRLDATVAVKVLRHVADASDDVTSRFTQEVSAAARNRHPNVVQVLDSDTIYSAGVPDCCYLVTEYLPGGTLQDWLRQHPGKSADCGNLRDGVRMLRQICSRNTPDHGRTAIPARFKRD